MIQMIPRLTRKPTGGRSRPSETLRTNACPTIRRLGVAGTKPEASSRGESPIICKRLYAVLKGRSSKAVTHAKSEEREDSSPRLAQSAIFATCPSKPVFGKSDVNEKALNPSPVISEWR